jgi:20S proteasome alpha/beta subunit
MTFVLGIRCLDGIVVSADSREQDNYIKRNVNKLHWKSIKHRGQVEWGIALAGAGSAGMAASFWDKLSLQLKGEYARTKIEESIEAAFNSIRQQHPDEPFEFVASIFGRRLIETKLYRTEGSCLSPKMEYCVAGQDATLANFLLESIYTPTIGVEEGARIAVFVTALMKEHGYGVGGPTNIIVHKLLDDTWRKLHPSEVSAIERKIPVGDPYLLLWNYWQKKTDDIPPGIGVVAPPRPQKWREFPISIGKIKRRSPRI